MQVVDEDDHRALVAERREHIEGAHAGGIRIARRVRRVAAQGQTGLQGRALGAGEFPEKGRMGHQ